MALPKINDTPSYELTIPSTKQQIHYRPFLVKEQKILLMALETQDEKQILKAIVDTIVSCCEQPIDTRSLATFDIEYIFTQIRGKSVGETANVMMKCVKCEGETEVQIPLDDIKIDTSFNNKIKLNDQYTLQMKFPTYEAILLAPEDKEGDSLAEAIYEMVIMCLDKLLTEEEAISFADESRADVEKFLESLNPEQFEKLIQFANNLPKLTHDVKYTCQECGHKNTGRLQGISDFF